MERETFDGFACLSAEPSSSSQKEGSQEDLHECVVSVVTVGEGMATGV